VGDGEDYLARSAAQFSEPAERTQFRLAEAPPRGPRGMGGPRRARAGPGGRRGGARRAAPPAARAGRPAPASGDGPRWAALKDSLARARAESPLAFEREVASLSEPLPRAFLGWLAAEGGEEEENILLELLRAREAAAGFPPPPEQLPSSALASASGLIPTPSSLVDPQMTVASFSAEARASRARSAQGLGSSGRAPRRKALRALGRASAADRIVAFLMQTPEESLERDVRDSVTPPPADPAVESPSSPSERLELYSESLYAPPAVLLQAVSRFENSMEASPLRTGRIRELLLTMLSQDPP